MIDERATVSVWVVYRDNGCEGMSKPLGVYFAKDIADIAASGGFGLKVHEIVTNSALEDAYA